MYSCALIEIASYTLGINNAKGMIIPVIKRNSPFPSKRSEWFTTVGDKQHTISIEIFEGERPLSKDNRFLGKFLFDGISPAP